jgi:hypothetical protein
MDASKANRSNHEQSYYTPHAACLKASKVGIKSLHGGIHPKDKACVSREQLR